MKPKLIQVSFLAALISGSVCMARADVVTDWNRNTLAAIKTDKTPPPVAARGLAMVHVAMYDAINGITRTHEPYLVTPKVPPKASAEASGAAAAHLVLVRLYPAQQAALDAAYAASLASIPADERRRKGIAWGEAVANAVLDERSNDGSATTIPHTPGTAPGDWQPTPPAFAAALLPQWKNVTPFAMTSPSQFRPSPPPAITSAMYAFEFRVTKDFGALNSTFRSAEQTDIAKFWGDGAGTVTPPGHWNVIARERAEQLGNTLEENARLFALLNLAEADAAIIAWECKYTYHYWRPVAAIRNAASDGNDATDADPVWTPLLVTPPFPEYISGHSTFSGAGAAVLANFFGTDNVAFTTLSDDLPGVSRQFDSFSQAAQEAGISRIYGGIHFLSANHAGLRSGEQLGNFVVQNFLRDRKGHSGRGR